MKTITSVFARPTTDIMWFFEHEIATGKTVYQDYIQKTLIDTNLLKQTRSYSDDRLVMTSVNELTEEGYDIWFNNPIIIIVRDEMLVYNTENNIVLQSLEIS
jgi:hypothetical protein